MCNIFKSAFKITNYNLILIIPLIVFVKVLDLYGYFVGADTLPKMFIASLTVMLMFAVFCSGWFYMIKEAINLSKQVFVLDSDRAHATFALFKHFLSGVGKYFVSFIGVYVIFFIIQILLTPIVYQLGVKLIGAVTTEYIQSLQALASAGTANMTASEALNYITPEMLMFFAKWSLFLTIITSIVMYILMLWIPEIIYKNKNSVAALGTSIIKLFKNFLNTFGLYIILWISGFILLFLNTFAMTNPFAYLLINLILFYFAIYMVVVIFLYYDKNFVANDEK